MNIQTQTARAVANGLLAQAQAYRDDARAQILEARSYIEAALKIHAWQDQRATIDLLHDAIRLLEEAERDRAEARQFEMCADDALRDATGAA